MRFDRGVSEARMLEEVPPILIRKSTNMIDWQPAEGPEPNADQEDVWFMFSSSSPDGTREAPCLINPYRMRLARERAAREARRPWNRFRAWVGRRFGC